MKAMVFLKNDVDKFIVVAKVLALIIVPNLFRLPISNHSLAVNFKYYLQ